MADNHGRTAVLEVYQPAIPKLRAELGYATTVHIAQGVTADTRHGVVMARSQGSSCLRGHLLLWPAPAPIRSLSCSPRLPAARRP